MGIDVEELPDGLVIKGSSEAPAPLTQDPGVPIACFKDHRIAMSFGVLGCRWPRVLITDKNCTDKTFPSFWDDLHLTFKIDVTGYTPAPARRSQRQVGICY